MSMIIFDQSKQLLYTVKISNISSQSHHILLFYYHQYFSRIPVYSFLLPFLHKLFGFFLFSYHLLAVLTFNPRYYWRFFFVKLLHPFLCLFIQFIMLADPCGKIEKLVGQLFAENRYIEAIKTAENKYLIKPFGLEKLQPNNILQSYYLLQKRFYSRDKFNSLQNWHQNQLKIFVWLLVGYSFLQNRCISQMDESDWAYFCQIFKRRDSTMIQHQSKLLVKRKQKNVKWVSDEIEILRNLMSKNSKKNMWNSIARNLYIISGKKYLRSSKQCRQYWINHLDPTLKKESWSYEQDYKLIQLAYENNKKWSKVSKLFDGKRTQHMVKNRFNSLYNMEIKRNPVVNKNLPEQQVMSMLKTRLVMMIKEDSENANFVKTYANMDQIQENDCQKNQQLEVKKQMSKVSSQRSQEQIQEQQYQMQEYSISPLESNQKKESKESEKQMLQIREYEDQANNSRQYSFFGIAQKDVEFIFDK